MSGEHQTERYPPSCGFPKLEKVEKIILKKQTLFSDRETKKSFDDTKTYTLQRKKVSIDLYKGVDVSFRNQTWLFNKHINVLFNTNIWINLIFSPFFPLKIPT